MRDIVGKNGLEQALFENLGDTLQRLFDLDPSTHRLDSVHIFSNMRHLGWEKLGTEAEENELFRTQNERLQAEMAQLGQRFPSLKSTSTEEISKLKNDLTEARGGLANLNKTKADFTAHLQKSWEESAERRAEPSELREALKTALEKKSRSAPPATSQAEVLGAAEKETQAARKGKDLAEQKAAMVEERARDLKELNARLEEKIENQSAELERLRDAQLTATASRADATARLDERGKHLAPSPAPKQGAKKRDKGEEGQRQR